MIDAQKLMEDPINRALLKTGEAGLAGQPFSHQPWDQLAAMAQKKYKTSVGGAEVRDRIRDLTRAGQVRYSRWILETGKLVGKTNTALVALAADSAQVNRAAEVLTNHPGVSHCYLRGDKGYNVWFTLAVPPEWSLESTAERLRDLCGGAAVRVLFAERMLKIQVAHTAASEKKAGDLADEAAEVVQPDAKGSILSEAEERCLELLWEPVDFSEGSPECGADEPYALRARAAGMDPADFEIRMRDLQNKKILRRFSVILNHRNAGISANGMCQWDVRDEQVDRLSALIPKFAAVTHAYLRTRYEDIPYRLYAMLHGPSFEWIKERKTAIDAAAGEAGIDIRATRVLVSGRELGMKPPCPVPSVHRAWFQKHDPTGLCRKRA
ncbi:MAG: hypothetical protein A3G34_00070 [Candidatus Lindowbacteria bacterium RIFCSPLOWO2_12_FULL_62_27]|nr:MAG: hypothetical protein A3G34_00070 [Candidatus Lindowbacteria bacterium RIFCSPLOWO2_12_FULL_62_27]OGH56681.1 MAG: hypothetical protein A3I06_07510 [Candidatus Lindowbacteria bacterium RIFCSPLOWO2_02_FULL_62_12]